MRVGLIGALLLAGCTSQEPATVEPGGNNAGGPEVGMREAEAAGGSRAPSWEMQSSDEGVALVLGTEPQATIRLFCPTGENSLLVNVPAFRPIASEERLSIGSRDRAEALVADAHGDSRRGGVSARGAVPDDLADLVGGGLSASYGAQTSGPHPPTPPTLARDFAIACGDQTGAESDEQAAKPANACVMQGSDRLRVKPLRAVGTEPFWGARIEGRCVTYSNPEDQSGTRVWTRYAKGPNGERWSGALGGQRFELVARRDPGCSDGMSDKVYPLAVDLIVKGERRTGCAEPLQPRPMPR